MREPVRDPVRYPYMDRSVSWSRSPSRSPSPTSPTSPKSFTSPKSPSPSPSPPLDRTHRSLTLPPYDRNDPYSGSNIRGETPLVWTQPTEKRRDPVPPHLSTTHTLPQGADTRLGLRRYTDNSPPRRTRSASPDNKSLSPLQGTSRTAAAFEGAIVAIIIMRVQNTLTRFREHATSMHKEIMGRRHWESTKKNEASRRSMKQSCLNLLL